MKRILKLFAVLWLIVGCSATQSTTQKLAGEYVYDNSLSGITLKFQYDLDSKTLTGSSGYAKGIVLNKK